VRSGALGGTSAVFEVSSAGAKLSLFFCVFVNSQFKLIQMVPAEITLNVISF
jgi:hypothetical protein